MDKWVYYVVGIGIIMSIAVLLISRKTTSSKKNSVIRNLWLGAIGLMIIGSAAFSRFYGVDRKPLIEVNYQFFEEIVADADRFFESYVETVTIAKIPYVFNKEITVIGDSITWEDSNVIEGVGKITGYQEQLRLAGAKVTTYGYSGSTFSFNENDKDRSLYKKIVLDKVSFKKAAIVTLFAGTNDVAFGIKNTNDKENTLIALKELIAYIKNDNTTCEIYILTPLYSTESRRSYEKLEKLSNELKQVAKETGAYSVDLFLESGINAGNQARYLYDGLHPNNAGMELIGTKVVETIEATNRVTKKQ